MEENPRVQRGVVKGGGGLGAGQQIGADTAEGDHGARTADEADEELALHHVLLKSEEWSPCWPTAGQGEEVASPSPASPGARLGHSAEAGADGPHLR
ncbi:hypothetical protein GCM10010307_28410 [Streptomyces vastus]|uniref:Uncharacterized protein n=1 Tax=Streptomyces vastus TaxID=285451 RepID=A0ABP6D2I0_9ACTN